MTRNTLVLFVFVYFSHVNDLLLLFLASSMYCNNSKKFAKLFWSRRERKSTKTEKFWVFSKQMKKWCESHTCSCRTDGFFSFRYQQTPNTNSSFQNKQIILTYVLFSSSFHGENAKYKSKRHHGESKMYPMSIYKHTYTYVCMKLLQKLSCWLLSKTHLFSHCTLHYT